MSNEDAINQLSIAEDVDDIIIALDDYSDAAFVMVLNAWYQNGYRFDTEAPDDSESGRVLDEAGHEVPMDVLLPIAIEVLHHARS